MATQDLLPLVTGVTSSSVLGRDVKQFGPRKALDGSNETCWNSDRGTTQHIILTLSEPALPTRLTLAFQGGFAGKLVSVQGLQQQQEQSEEPKADSSASVASWVTLGEVRPKDSNAVQTFDIPAASEERYSRIKVLFSECSDFFGRVVVYTLGLEGQV
ncbi:hypothetical protein GQ42DRAFT_165313 [Ramicandelaber brevisporus]|nr:hypothetical protein GQ42DRAFT_165855 [Ramicandelaber brevisporus]KAI8866714.1 hypothetical protein GQ42DRAFT_165313 [Ramicandelaber brevisporus]